MNFDYESDSLQRFTISSGPQGNTFQLSSRVPFGFIELVGMNSKGLFASCQGLIPSGKPPATRIKDQISTAIFHRMVVSRFNLVSQVKKLLERRRVVHIEGTSFHNLVVTNRAMP